MKTGTDKSTLLIGSLIVLTLILLVARWDVPRISIDQIRQMVALENLYAGEGVSFQFVEEHDEPTLHSSFPLGYYALMLPFRVLVDDVILLHRFIELLGLLLIVYQLYLLASWLVRTYSLKYLGYFLILFSLIQLNPWRSMGFTDIWSLFFFITAFRFAVTKPLSYGNLVLIGLISFFTVFMRYAYYPLAFIPPALALLRLPYRQFSTYMPLVLLTGR